MKKSLISLVFALSITSLSIAQVKISDPVDYVNPLMGTDSKPSLSNGNTYPAIAVPWANESLDTANRKNGRWVGLPIHVQ